MNSIIIFRGNTTKLEMVGEYQLIINGLKRDISGEVTFPLVVSDEEKEIRALDVFYFEVNNISHIGRIKAVMHDDGKATMNILIGESCLTEIINMPENVLNPVKLSGNQRTPINYSITSSNYVSGSDGDLDISTIIRQLARKQETSIVMDFDEYNSKLNLVVTDYENQGFSEIDLNNEPLISGVEYNFPSSQPNNLRLIDEQDQNNYVDYYLQDNGVVGTDINLAILPIIPKSQKTQSWDKLNYASSQLKSQEYNNEISFYYPLNPPENKKIYALEYNETFLGRKLKVYIDEIDTTVNTIISAVEIDDEIMHIKLGLSRKKFSDQQRKDVI